ARLRLEAGRVRGDRDEMPFPRELIQRRREGLLAEPLASLRPRHDTIDSGAGRGDDAAMDAQVFLETRLEARAARHLRRDLRRELHEDRGARGHGDRTLSRLRVDGAR